MIEQYFWNVLISIDQFINTVFGPVLNLFLHVNPKDPFGKPDETLSSVFAKNVDNCKACKLMCRFLNMFHEKHCSKVIELDE